MTQIILSHIQVIVGGLENSKSSLEAWFTFIADQILAGKNHPQLPR